MKRRTFLSLAAKATAAGAASTVFAAPNIIIAQRNIRWQMATSWPVSLDTIFGGAQIFAERVAAMTNGRFQITPEPAGKLAPPLQVLDAVQQGSVPCGHTASYYYVGKSPVTALGTAIPFGMTLRQQNAWLYEGGGLKLLQDFYRQKFGVIQFPAGNTGAQMGGWFRKEIKTVDDLKGLKMRIPGLGGEVLRRLGVTAQNFSGGEIFQALQTGTVDAAEWVGPYDDEKLGLFKVAKFYYYPGWWEPAPTLEVEINLREWERLPKEYQEVIKTAAVEANMGMMARYDARNAAALKKLRDAGVQLRQYPKAIIDAAKKAADELYAEFSSKDADFRRIFAEWKKFKEETDSWFGLNEYAMESYLFGKM
ncbi:MAG: TRAP transporter substrate-binding protein [Anaerolineae bacterium]|nr:TRAP transporter substrate-binding protein [Anaerolineae bacterium]